jgi:hypothetical protein
VRNLTCDQHAVTRFKTEAFVADFNNIPPCIKQNSVHPGKTLGCGTSWSSPCLAGLFFCDPGAGFCRITKLPAKAEGKPSAHAPLS